MVHQSWDLLRSQSQAGCLSVDVFNSLSLSLHKSFLSRWQLQVSTWYCRVGWAILGHLVIGSQVGYIGNMKSLFFSWAPGWSAAPISRLIVFLCNEKSFSPLILHEDGAALHFLGKCLTTARSEFHRSYQWSCSIMGMRYLSHFIWS